MKIVSVIALTVLSLVNAKPEPPVNQYLPPNQQYAPQGNGIEYPGISRVPSGPGTPSGSNGPSGPGGLANNQYLPPNGQINSLVNGGYNSDANDTPAKYDFEYMVNDQETGNDFGHKENRDGDLTRGVYYVLLPDGRRQTVEYEADQDGFRPKVTYTQEGNGIGNGNGGGNGNQGYPDSNSGYRY
ncbi:pro-resilin [Cephus cinctus]|uniref:Pro-resilin n=1 Tax=Cephus cinctus TaxID=211228 RepID=A0AAJ7C3A3_CEPCN|nr:pro-resilin [Cephus cinctus]